MATLMKLRCCCYHKGTYFQANHNRNYVRCASDKLLLLPQRYIFSSKSQPIGETGGIGGGCCCYHKGTYFQANHNSVAMTSTKAMVVVATTKVHIFKQITTPLACQLVCLMLLLLPQRYIFSSKSQLNRLKTRFSRGCCCYHKGTYFQANHNSAFLLMCRLSVVVATTKVHIFKQITTRVKQYRIQLELLLLPQRYIFSSKSQPHLANIMTQGVVVATTKVHIFKQITTYVPTYSKYK